jgi:hypothetical protein
MRCVASRDEVAPASAGVALRLDHRLSLQGPSPRLGEGKARCAPRERDQFAARMPGMPRTGAAIPTAASPRPRPKLPALFFQWHRLKPVTPLVPFCHSRASEMSGARGIPILCPAESRKFCYTNVSGRSAGGRPSCFMKAQPQRRSGFDRNGSVPPRQKRSKKVIFAKRTQIRVPLEIGKIQ